MHVKCRYCGTDCWDIEARNGHEPLCNQNPALYGGHAPEKHPVVCETVATVSGGTAITGNTAVLTPELPMSVLVFGGKSHPGETPEEVIKTDRTYIEWAASLYRDPAIKQRCKELLMGNKA
jgi:hypothetical protein